jgi:hypothetical protein
MLDAGQLDAILVCELNSREMYLAKPNQTRLVKFTDF